MFFGHVILLLVWAGTHPDPQETSFPGHTYYAAPESEKPAGDGLSPSQPFPIQDFWKVAKPGDTLLLLDGRYMGSASMIYVDSSMAVNGTADGPITIRALNEGNVRIDGEGRHLPIRISGAGGAPKRYFVVEGIDACNSGDAVVMLSRCEDCTVRRVCAWNAKPETNSHVYTLDRTFRCLVEDCAAWGLGRKQFLIYGGTSNQDEPYGADNILRRFWCRWEGTRNLRHSENISFQYRATRSLLENVICTYDAWESIEYPPTWTFSGFYYTDGPAEHIANTRLLGCVGYAPGASNVLSSSIFLITGLDVLDVTLQDCLSYVAPARTRGLPDSSIRGLVTYARHYDSVHVEHLTVVGGAGIKLGARLPGVDPNGPVVRNALIMKTVDTTETGQPAVVRPQYVDTIHFFDNVENFAFLASPADAPAHILSPPGFGNGSSDLAQMNLNCRVGRGTDPQLDAPGRSLLRPHTSPALRHAAPDGNDVGARLWFRYVDGVLKDGRTDGRIEYLWPWPMEARIWRATLEYHLLDPVNHPRPVSVTREVLTLDGGSLPGDFDGDGDVDDADLATFNRCRTGPNIPAEDANGYSVDFDEDDDIDGDDRLVFDRWYGYTRPDFALYRLLFVRAAAPDVPISASLVDLRGASSGVGTFTRLYEPQTVVQLTAPQEVNGRAFGHWELNGQALANGRRLLSVVMNDDQTAEAVYLGD